MGFNYGPEQPWNLIVGFVTETNDNGSTALVQICCNVVLR